MALIGTGVGSVLNGFINESNGGSFLGGWVGGQISGVLSIIPGIGPILGVFLGSIATDLIDNKGDWGRVNWGKVGFSALIAFGLNMFPMIAGLGMGNALYKDVALQFILSYQGMLLGICNSIVNVFWEGRKKHEEERKQLFT